MQKIKYPVIGSQSVYPVYVAGMGISDYEHHVNREDGLISHQFLFTKSGAGRLNIDGNSYRLDKNSFLYIAPSVPHEYYPETKQWTTCWVVFRGKHLNELMSEMGFGSYLIQNIRSTRSFERLFDMMMAADNISAGGEKCSLLMYEYIIEVHRLITGKSAEVPGDNVVGKCISFIDSNYMKDITLENLCTLSEVSPQHLCRLFRKQTGMRPMEYIAQRRIAQAKSLLQETDMPVSEIGISVGYPDPTYFGVVFRKYEGTSPGGYRKRRSSIPI